MSRRVRQPGRRGLLAMLGVSLASLTRGCEPYRIEYRPRPAYQQAASKEALPDRVQLPDGTVIVYRDPPKSHSRKRDDCGKEVEAFQPRRELEDGSVVVRNLIPEHVFVNTLTCLQNQEYEVIWDQLLAEETRRAYEREEQGREKFIEFFRKHRQDLAKTVNRMFYGLARNEVVIDRVGPGVLRYRFIRQIAGHFRFRSLTMSSDPLGMKLVMIE